MLIVELVLGYAQRLCPEMMGRDVPLDLVQFCYKVRSSRKEVKLGSRIKA